MATAEAHGARMVERQHFPAGCLARFYTIFSLAPVLLIVVGIAGVFLARETAVA
jgi:uncharacterized BrkB/YihY/UPF0761 family membrane protein